jgi:DNA-binding CsgD family transcriptional regulator
MCKKVCARQSLSTGRSRHRTLRRLEGALASTNRTGNTFRSWPQNDWSSLWAPFAEALEELSSSLDNSTVAVAFFDHRLRCQALNRAFAGTWSAAPEKFLGKTLSQSVGRDAKKLTGALERVRSTGVITCNLTLGRPLVESRTSLSLSTNLYPVADDTGRVRLVAVTIGESSALDFQFANLAAQLQRGLPTAMCLLGASFPEVLARSLQSSGRSIRRLRTSLTSRSPLNGTQLEISLMPLALYLSLTGARSAATQVSASEQVASPKAVPAETSEAAPTVLLEDPSPRELQVLRLLAVGRSNKEIGLGLGISTRTVETYRARLIRKLGVHSTAELVRYAIRHKIVEA